MATIAFDTLKASRDLQAAGITEAHAEAIVGSMAEAFSDTVATKADIAAVQADIGALEVSTKADIAAVQADIAALEVSTKADIAALEISTKADIANLKAEMFRALWIQGAGLVGVQLAIAGLLYTLLAAVVAGA